jgi:hypothetical protein
VKSGPIPLLLVAVIACCAPGPTVVTSSPPAATSTPTATTAVLATASPSRSPASTAAFAGPMDLVRVTVPPEFTYVMLPYGNDGAGRAIFRLVLLDLTAGRVIEAGRVAVDMPAGSQAAADATTSASRDGRVVVLTTTMPSGATTFYAVHPETAEFMPLAVEPEHYGTAVVSPDGARFAFTRGSSDPTATGIWMGSTSGGPLRQLVHDVPDVVPPMALAFSDDSAWLAFDVILGEGDVVVGVVRPTGSARVDRAARALVGDGRLIGPGSQVDWRGGGSALLVRSSRSLFGGQNIVTSYDLGSGRARELYRPTTDVAIDHVAWHPSVDRFVELERPSCCGITGDTVWIRYVDGRAPVKLADSLLISTPWWSRDGSRLFALAGGDDSLGGVTDLLTRQGVLTFCKRSIGPPPCT